MAKSTQARHMRGKVLSHGTVMEIAKGEPMSKVYDAIDVMSSGVVMDRPLGLRAGIVSEEDMKRITLDDTPSQDVAPGLELVWGTIDGNHAVFVRLHGVLIYDRHFVDLAEREMLRKASKASYLSAHKKAVELGNKAHDERIAYELKHYARLTR